MLLATQLSVVNVVVQQLFFIVFLTIFCNNKGERKYESPGISNNKFVTLKCSCFLDMTRWNLFLAWKTKQNKTKE